MDNSSTNVLIAPQTAKKAGGQPGPPRGNPRYAWAGHFFYRPHLPLTHENERILPDQPATLVVTGLQAKHANNPPGPGILYCAGIAPQIGYMNLTA